MTLDQKRALVRELTSGVDYYRKQSDDRQRAEAQAYLDPSVTVEERLRYARDFLDEKLYLLLLVERDIAAQERADEERNQLYGLRRNAEGKLESKGE